MARLGVSDLHQEVYDFYQGFRGVPAPVNTYTESLWREIERLEGERG